MKTELEKVALKSQLNPKLLFTSLAHYVSKEALFSALKSIPNQTGKGVDAESKKEAMSHFDCWSDTLLEQVHTKRYKPQPVRRVFIPKPGKDALRPIGVPCIRDRALQKVTSEILASIYESDFLPISFGGRPKKNAHQAIARVCKTTADCKTSWVLEADLQNFFGSLDHGWLIKFIELRVGDPRILSLIRRWLKAGVMNQNEFTETSEGVPQGGSISVILSNVYLHYALDLWFEKLVKPHLQGEAHLIRYLDDFMICFQLKSDADRVFKALPDRLKKFGLSLEASKTRLVPFGRFSYRDSKQYGFRKPPTLGFLGFTLYVSKTPWGHRTVIPKVKASRLSRFQATLNETMMKQRHFPIKEQSKAINIRLRGFCNYFGVLLSSGMMKSLYHRIVRYWRKVLSSRSQSGAINWKKFKIIMEKFPIAKPKLAFPSEKWTQLLQSQVVH